MKYLALLRGINVGGNNIIKMADLRACLECTGLRNVTTFIQSGNVLFESPLRNAVKVAEVIEKALGDSFSYHARTVVVTQRDMEQVVSAAPPKFGADPAKYRYDVIFVRAPLRADELQSSISLKDGVDEVVASNGVLYFSRLIARAAESKLPKFINHPAYKRVTIRNWNTTTKLCELMRAPLD
jgi:uncharacterized protein (DUF1697 family)